MTQRATVEELEKDVERALVREDATRVAFVRAVEYRARITVALELARKREREEQDSGE